MELVKHVDEVFLENGAPKKDYDCAQRETEDLKRKAAAVGAQFIPIPQRHIGTDNAPKVIQNLEEKLKELGPSPLTMSNVADSGDNGVKSTAQTIG